MGNALRMVVSNDLYNTHAIQMSNLSQCGACPSVCGTFSAPTRLINVRSLILDLLNGFIANIHFNKATHLWQKSYPTSRDSLRKLLIQDIPTSKDYPQIALSPFWHDDTIHKSARIHLNLSLICRIQGGSERSMHCRLFNTPTACPSLSLIASNPHFVF